MAPPPPPKCGGGGGGSSMRRILQGTFDDLVRGNIEDLRMDPAEALLELFRDCHGPKTIFGILDVIENLETLAAGFSVVAMAATANEFFKESYEIKDR